MYFKDVVIKLGKNLRHGLPVLIDVSGLDNVATNIDSVIQELGDTNTKYYIKNDQMCKIKEDSVVPRVECRHYRMHFPGLVNTLTNVWSFPASMIFQGSYLFCVFGRGTSADDDILAQNGLCCPNRCPKATS